MDKMEKMKQEIKKQLENDLGFAQYLGVQVVSALKRMIELMPDYVEWENTEGAKLAGTLGIMITPIIQNTLDACHIKMTPSNYYNLVRVFLWGYWMAKNNIGDTSIN